MSIQSIYKFSDHFIVCSSLLFKSTNLNGIKSFKKSYLSTFYSKKNQKNSIIFVHFSSFGFTFNFCNAVSNSDTINLNVGLLRGYLYVHIKKIFNTCSLPYLGIDMWWFGLLPTSPMICAVDKSLYGILPVIIYQTKMPKLYTSE